MNFKLAWRNLWRNKRRTYITIGSIFFAVILATLMMSIKEGVYTNMIKTMIGDYTGYVQVHKAGYWNDKIIDNIMERDPEVLKQIQNHQGVTGYLPRLESFALAVSDSLTQGVLVSGVDAEKEKSLSNLHLKVTTGEYLLNNDSAVLMGVGLAEYLKVKVGDTLVMLGQGYHGASAVGKYLIKGLVKFGSPELSKKLVFMPLSKAQYFYAAPNKISNIILQLDDNDKAPKVATALGKAIPGDYEVMDWEALTPELKNMIETDRVEGYVFMFILYMVISFGIFGTMLMMLAERQHEFGVLVAVGMKRMILATMVWLEVVILSLMGAVIGMIGAFPVCLWFYLRPIRFAKGEEMAEMYEEYGMEPILQASIEPDIFIQQATVVFIIAVIISIYPVLKLNRLDAIKSMRS